MKQIRPVVDRGLERSRSMTPIGDVIAQLAPSAPKQPATRKLQLAVDLIQSTEEVDFDAWARRYVAALLEAAGLPVPADWHETQEAA